MSECLVDDERNKMYSKEDLSLISVRKVYFVEQKIQFCTLIESECGCILAFYLFQKKTQPVKCLN